MKNLVHRYLPEEVIRALQAAYWSVRLFRIVQEL